VIGLNLVMGYAGQVSLGTPVSSDRRLCLRDPHLALRLATAGGDGRWDVGTGLLAFTVAPRSCA